MKYAAALFVVLCLSTVPAYSEETTDADYACSLPEPAPPLLKPHTRGIDLSTIVKQQLGATGSFTTTVEPTVQLDLDFGSRTVNLTNGPAKGGLVFADSRNGYEAYDFGQIEGGVGGAMSFNFGNSTFLAPAPWAAVGLLPLVGGSVEGYRFYGDRASLDRRVTVPNRGASLKTLDALRVHDAIAYDTTGGIVFWAGAGFGVVGAVSVGAVAQGQFEVRLEKLDADHVYVRILNADLKSLGLQAGNALVNAGTANFSRYAGSLGFAINFHDRVGAEAYEDLVAGNAAPVQKLAKAGGDAVRFVDDASSRRLGVSSRFWAGIPILMGVSWTKMRYFEALRDRFYSCGRGLRATYGAYVQRFEGKAFGVGQQTTKAFYGTSYALEAAKGDEPVARGFFGELVWSYKGNKTQADTFRNAAGRLAADTGLGDSLLLSIPANVTGRLGYTSLTVRAQFDAAHALHLIQRAAGFGRARLADFATGMARSYLSTALNTESLCQSLAAGDEATTPAPAACEAAVVSNTNAGTDQMISALTELDKALKAGDEKGATGAFAKFGEAMLTNRFTLETGLRLAGGGVPVDFVAEGSDFFRRVSLSKTDGDTGRLVPDNRKPLFEPLDGRGPRVSDTMLVLPH